MTTDITSKFVEADFEDWVWPDYAIYELPIHQAFEKYARQVAALVANEVAKSIDVTIDDGRDDEPPGKLRVFIFEFEHLLAKVDLLKVLTDELKMDGYYVIPVWVDYLRKMATTLEEQLAKLYPPDLEYTAKVARIAKKKGVGMACAEHHMIRANLRRKPRKPREA